MSETIPGPCVMCGATNYALSYGGPTICPVCDCGGAEAGLRVRLAAAEERAEKAEAVVAKLPAIVKDLYNRREFAQCWYDTMGDEQADCGNWPTCPEDCSLRSLGMMVGLVPQEDGGLDKQAEAAEAATQTPQAEASPAPPPG